MNIRRTLITVGAFALITSGGIIGFSSVSNASNSNENGGREILADFGSTSSTAMNQIPKEMAKTINMPNELPFDLKTTNHTAMASKIGENYYYEEYWNTDNMEFTVNVLDTVVEIAKTDHPDYQYQEVKLLNGKTGTYIKGPSTEKIYWDDNGYQYVIVHKLVESQVSDSKSTTEVFKPTYFGLEKFSEMANSMK